MAGRECHEKPWVDKQSDGIAEGSEDCWHRFFNEELESSYMPWVGKMRKRSKGLELI